MLYSWLDLSTPLFMTKACDRASVWGWGGSRSEESEESEREEPSVAAIRAIGAMSDAGSVWGGRNGLGT